MAIRSGLLQAAGSAVIAAGSPAPNELVTALAARGWQGDQDLIDQMSGISGRITVIVDLQDLGDLLSTDESGLVDLQTGWCYPSSFIYDGGLAEDPDEDPDRWLYVDGYGSREAWRDMQEFAEELPDQEFGHRLLRAINGRGAFRRFRDAVGEDARHEAAWLAFSNERRKGRARAWLAEQGYDPVRQE